MSGSTKKTSDAMLRAIAEYDKKNTTGLYLKLNNHTDADIMEYLNTKSNKQGFIKNLIRTEMQKENE